MLNKRIISAAAAVVVALGGFGAPVFGGIAQNFDIAASAFSYGYDDFKANIIARGATDRMIEEVENFVGANKDYFTAGDYAAFIETTDKVYENVMLPACKKAYGQDPADLSDAERRDVLKNYVSASNKSKAYDVIRKCGAEHGVDVTYKVENGVIYPICKLTRTSVPAKNTITVDVKKGKNDKVDLTTATVSIISGKKTYSQDCDANGTVEVTDLLNKGDKVQISMPGFATRTIEYDGETDLSKIAIAKYGDLNGDGKIDLNDLLLMQKLVAKWDVADEVVYMEVADVDVDGDVDVNDLILMQKYVAKWDVELGIPSVQA